MARILITNDDGVPSEGLWALARAVLAAGHDIVVVAPIDERSGAGAAVGHIVPGEPIPCASVVRDDLPGVACWALSGPPALCTLLAVRGGFGPPFDAVCAGINPGFNSGLSVLHSGTVGAVLTAANQGISGVATSIGFAVEQPVGPAGSVGETPASTRGYHWETAADLAVLALAAVLVAPAGTAINLNVPNRGADTLAGIVEVPLARYPLGITRIDAGPAGGSIVIGVGPPAQQPLPDTDSGALLEGFVTVTHLVPPRGISGGEATVAALLMGTGLSGPGQHT